MRKQATEITFADLQLNEELPESPLTCIIQHTTLFASDTELEDHINNECLLFCFRQLTSLEQSVLSMRIVDEYKHDEIACCLQISPEAVRKLYQRAIRKLQTNMRKGNW